MVMVLACITLGYPLLMEVDSWHFHKLDQPSSVVEDPLLTALIIKTLMYDTIACSMRVGAGVIAILKEVACIIIGVVEAAVEDRDYHLHSAVLAYQRYSENASWEAHLHSAIRVRFPDYRSVEVMFFNLGHNPYL